MIPYMNARLTLIAGGGSAPDDDDPGTTGTSKWVGAQGIYVAEEIVEAIGGDRVDEIKQTRLEVPYTVGQLIVRGDTLTYTYRGTTESRVAGTITGDPLVGRTRVMAENS